MKPLFFLWAWLALAPALAGARAPRGRDLTLAYTYDEYLRDFGKARPPRGSAAYSAGAERFAARLRDIVAHNARGDATYVKGVNHLTDLPEAPKGLARWATPTTSSATRREELGFAVESEAALPASVDWRDKGVVTAVKDQGGCGSCWAFAATATMESHIALKTGLLFDLSPQELVSCMPNPRECGGTGGCKGATAELAFQYYAQHDGVVQEFQMGYSSYQGAEAACTLLGPGGANNATIRGGVATIDSYVKLPANDPLALLNALHKVGPVAVSVDAAWRDYESGVFTSPDFDAHIDHAVVLVGYGTDEESKLPYCLIRNSWSPTWGERGYIRLRRYPTTDHATAPPCGLDTKPRDGFGCSGGPANVTVCGTSGVLADSSFPVGGRLI